MTALESIRDAGIHIFVAATGAGAGIQQDLWSTPGISKVLVGAQFPYAGKETDEFLGFHPAKYVSEDTAIEMASAAYIRAKAVAGVHGKAVGLGLTASTSTNYDKRSPNEVYAAVVGDTGCWVRHVVLIDDHIPGLERHYHGQECDGLGLGMLQYAVTGKDCVSWTRGEQVRDCTARVEELFWDHPVFMPTGQRLEALPKDHCIFPGTFNPPHEGHHDMAERTEFWEYMQVVYEINVDSPHKGDLSAVECLARAAYFKADRYQAPRSLRFTKGMPLFTDKVKAGGFEAQFIMGSDTLERILDPKWGPSTEQVLETFMEYDTVIHVFDRWTKNEDGTMRFIEAMALVNSLDKRYHDRFNYRGTSKSISSTDIRNAK